MGTNYALLIDDDVPLLQSVQRAAMEEGLELVVARTWDEGLALFHVHSPTLVIADYNLEGSSHGLKLLAEMRAIRPSGRLVLVSAYIDATDARRIEELGLVDRALPKTEAVETMRVLIDEIRDASRVARVGTDWQEYAEADVRARRVSREALEELDRAIKAKRGIE